MNVIHRIVFSTGHDGPEIQRLKELGVKYEFDELPSTTSANLGLVTFEVSENHPEWPNIRETTEQCNATDVVRTEFKKAELTNSKFLAIFGNWHNGYPMPENNDGYIDETYGGTGCRKCGVGRVQNAPFRLRGEPKWGRRHVMKLNWITDELFITPHLYETVFAPQGIEYREVLHYKTLRPLETVVQIAVPNSTVRLQTTELDEECDECGSGKSHWPTRGYFPGLDERETAAAFKPCHYFGSGGSAGKAIIVSQELYRLFETEAVKGCYFEPLAE